MGRSARNCCGKSVLADGKGAKQLNDEPMVM
jgi:hypothetical protein